MTGRRHPDHFEADARQTVDQLADLFPAHPLDWLGFAGALFDALHQRITEDAAKTIAWGVPAELVSVAMGYGPGQSDSMAEHWDVGTAIAGQDWLIGHSDAWVSAVQALLDLRDQLVLRPLLGRADEAEDMVDELVTLVERVHADPDNLPALARFGPAHCWWWRKLLPLPEQPEAVRQALRRIDSLTVHYREAAQS